MVTLLRVTYKFYTLILYSILLYITVQLIACSIEYISMLTATTGCMVHWPNVTYVTRPCHFSITVSC